MCRLTYLRSSKIESLNQTTIKVGEDFEVEELRFLFKIIIQSLVIRTLILTTGAYEIEDIERYNKSHHHKEIIFSLEPNNNTFKRTLSVLIR